MIQFAWHCSVILALLFSSMTMKAADPAPKADAPKPAPPKEAPKKSPWKKTDKPAVEMNYGPYMATTIGTSWTSNITPKGIVLKLNKELNANICFDTELLRVSHAWTGGFLHLQGRNFADDSNDFSVVDGTIQFSSDYTPGWTSTEQRDDPRTPKDGPLPKTWGRYKGLYLNGEQVVLAYTVGDALIHEQMSASVMNQIAVFHRSFTMGPTTKPLSMLVCETEKDAKAELAPIAKITLKEGAIAAGLVGAPKDAAFEFVNGRLYLKLPPLAASTSFSVLASKLPDADEKPFAALLTSTPPNLTELIKGGAPRWTETITTQGTLAANNDAPYVIDTITAPAVNPYKSWLRFTGMDIFADGKRAALSTWNGDVWIVSGLDEKLESLSWKRFATGLSQPLGLKIVNDIVFTVGRDQITRFHDLNKDGEADFYENFNNDCILTTNFHECCFDLQTDKEGNFWYTKGSSIWAGNQRVHAHSGSVIKVSKDGSTLESLCSGLRAPNGLAIGPEGEITVTDNQGNWVPMCPIYQFRKGAYYGFVGKDQKQRDEKEIEKPICWVPFSMDKSTAGMVWCDSEKWGPFKGRMIETSYTSGIYNVLMEKSGDQIVQGGVVKFPLAFPSGVMRGRFNPVDGQLYLSGMRGWSSSAAKDHIFQRVRFTGKPVIVPVQAKVRKGGIDITFSGTLDAASVADLQNIGVQWANIKRSGNYGSDEWNITDPKKKGRETVEVKSAKLLEDGKTIALEIPTLQPVNIMVLKFKLKAADGSAVNPELGYTINKIPE